MYHLWSNSPLCYSEPYYNLGLTLYYQNRLDEAYDVFYKATWSNEQQEMSFYYLAAIETGRGNLESALELVEKGLVKNAHNIKARGLKAVILRKLGRKEEAKAWCIENIKVDPFDYVSRFELAADAEEAQTILDEMNELMRDFHGASKKNALINGVTAAACSFISIGTCMDAANVGKTGFTLVEKALFGLENGLIYSSITEAMSRTNTNKKNKSKKQEKSKAKANTNVKKRRSRTQMLQDHSLQKMKSLGYYA